MNEDNGPSADKVFVVNFTKNLYFQEYKDMMNARGMDAMAAESKRWKTAEMRNAIFQMTPRRQSLYADYVTKKMTELDMELFLTFVEIDMLTDFGDIKPNASAVGNVAMAMLHIKKESPNHPFIAKLVKILNDWKRKFI